jgi:predicted nucleic acid-binding Zn ribbon protein
MRRRDPYRLAEALEPLLREAQPNTPLAAIQSAWPEAVGETIAGWATPATERDGVVTIHCDDSVTAHHLNSMQLEIAEKLRKAVPQITVRELRFRAGPRR